MSKQISRRFRHLFDVVREGNCEVLELMIFAFSKQNCELQAVYHTQEVEIQLKSEMLSATCICTEIKQKHCWATFVMVYLEAVYF